MKSFEHHNKLMFLKSMKPLLKHGRSHPEPKKDDLTASEYNSLPSAIWTLLGSIAPWLIIAIIIVFRSCTLAHAEPLIINYDDKAILSIIGEAEDQGYQGMLAVAGAIRNRGNLKRVYGYHSLRVRHHLYSQLVYNNASYAWQESKFRDISNGATGWGNASDIEIFKKYAWWKNCTITMVIKDHTFYKCN